MPPQLLLAIVIESCLVTISLVLLAGPGLRVEEGATGARLARAAGQVFLCATFCWSVVLGTVLTLNGYATRF